MTDRDLSAWCELWLGSRVETTLFHSGHLSAVTGVRLEDGREVVVKVRPFHKRLAGCAVVHEHLWRAGFACPQPLSGPVPLGELAASAESLMAEPGQAEDGRSAGPPEYAALLAELIRLAPADWEVPDLAPAPAWMHWYHEERGIWPMPDDRPEDLNATPGPDWLDQAGRLARERLAAVRGSDRVIGHADWWSGNITWHGDRPWAVHDWDSVVAEPETVIAGQAAAVWSASATCHGADIGQTEAFLEAYQDARGAAFSQEEIEQAWAAGLWVKAFNAKKYGAGTLGQAEAEERRRRAGC